MNDARGSEKTLFGTDGIRGTPGVYPLTDGMLFKIGVSVAKSIQYRAGQKRASKVIIGRDVRLTGSRIESILSDAIVFHGIDAVLTGVITTPGLSFLVKDLGADMGIMISASHNKASDNGIKFFNQDGFKLSAEEEAWLENVLFSNLINVPNGTTNKKIGRVHFLDNAQSRYVKFLLSTCPGLDLKGIQVVLDCGWGAASGFAPRIFKKMGAHLTSMHNKPSGKKINQGGSVNPSYLRDLVLQREADIGIALDGDGDRCILVDEKGNILDGDYILAIIGNFLLKEDKLRSKTVVGTVMSNMGLKESLENNGAKLITTKVGDKYVLKALLDNKLNLGGEQSGHIVFLDYLPSPDGILTGLQVLRVMKETGLSLSKLKRCMRKFPQVLTNVDVREKMPFEDIPFLASRLEQYNQELKTSGRILLRHSGTENVARIMVEGKDENMIKEIADCLAGVIKEEIGLELEGNHV